MYCLFVLSAYWIIVQFMAPSMTVVSNFYSVCSIACLTVAGTLGSFNASAPGILYTNFCRFLTVFAGYPLKLITLLGTLSTSVLFSTTLMVLSSVASLLASDLTLSLHSPTLTALTLPYISTVIIPCGSTDHSIYLLVTCWKLLNARLS